jgi:excisionase family DNA binding protein
VTAPPPPRRPYTPASLAAEWQCSANHIRNLINNGELRAFRLGGKLLRIPADAVEEFLRRRDTLADQMDSPASPELETDSDGPLKRAALRRIRQRARDDP